MLFVLDIDDSTSVRRACLRCYDLPPNIAGKLVLVNGHYIAPEALALRRLLEGDHLAVWPPIAGG